MTDKCWYAIKFNQPNNYHHQMQFSVKLKTLLFVGQGSLSTAVSPSTKQFLVIVIFMVFLTLICNR